MMSHYQDSQRNGPSAGSFPVRSVPVHVDCTAPGQECRHYVGQREYMYEGRKYKFLAHCTKGKFQFPRVCSEYEARPVTPVAEDA